VSARRHADESDAQSIQSNVSCATDAQSTAVHTTDTTSPTTAVSSNTIHSTAGETSPTPRSDHAVNEVDATSIESLTPSGMLSGCDFWKISV
jgi:glyceraldehyde-3-phosphate dehydrogenase/erythrose-4-phosphate dehydrogenase